MKEATGELNGAVVVVLSIGVLVTFFFSYIWPSIKNNFESNSQCEKATCNCNDDPNKGPVGRQEINGATYCICSIKGGQRFRCIYKG